MVPVTEYKTVFVTQKCQKRDKPRVSTDFAMFLDDTLYSTQAYKNPTGKKSAGCFSTFEETWLLANCLKQRDAAEESDNNGLFKGTNRTCVAYRSPPRAQNITFYHSLLTGTRACSRPSFCLVHNFLSSALTNNYNFTQNSYKVAGEQLQEF